MVAQIMNRGRSTAVVTQWNNVRRCKKNIRWLLPQLPRQAHMRPQATPRYHYFRYIVRLGKQICWWWQIEVKTNDVPFGSRLWNKGANQKKSIRFCASTLSANRAAGVDANDHERTPGLLLKQTSFAGSFK
jgi:hypothetical protein